jgi:hypothetical protein
MEAVKNGLGFKKIGRSKAAARIGCAENAFVGGCLVDKVAIKRTE